MHIERECQPKIAAQMALVEFVEQDGADVFECRIVLDQSSQNAFGDYFNARAGRYLVVEPDAVAHGVANILAQLLCHERRCCACCHAARLQYQDLLACTPRRIQQRQRHLGGLAGAGRCFEHEARV